MAAFNSMPAMPAAPTAPNDAMGMNHGPPPPMGMDSFDPELNFHESLLYVEPFELSFSLGVAGNRSTSRSHLSPFPPSPLNFATDSQQRM
jgi:hypothetical protein